MPSTHQNTVFTKVSEYAGSRTMALPNPAEATIVAICTRMLASAKTPKSAGASSRASTANSTKVTMATQTDLRIDHSEATIVLRFKLVTWVMRSRFPQRVRAGGSAIRRGMSIEGGRGAGSRSREAAGYRQPRGY